VQVDGVDTMDEGGRSEQARRRMAPAFTKIFVAREQSGILCLIYTHLAGMTLRKDLLRSLPIDRKNQIENHENAD
jgi:hypothetical protein